MDLDLQLTADGSDWVPRTNRELVRELIEAGLQVWAGSWVYDLREGVPYQRDADPSARELIRSDIYACLIATPGVESVETITTRIDAPTRKIWIDWRVKLDSGVSESGTVSAGA